MGKVTGIYQCPACSRSVTYRSDHTRLIVCSCGQVLNRLESDELIVKPAYILQDHNDWLRVGSKGVFEKRKFELLGRFRCWLDESVYNYWTVIFDDGDVAWLAEGYGTYFDPRLRRKYRRPLLFIPLIGFIAGVLLYWQGALLFWRLLAYLAVFHFIRQQYGFLRIYSRQEKNPAWVRWTDTFTIYYATIYPLLYSIMGCWRSMSCARGGRLTGTGRSIFRGPRS